MKESKLFRQLNSSVRTICVLVLLRGGSLVIVFSRPAGNTVSTSIGVSQALPDPVANRLAGSLRERRNANTTVFPCSDRRHAGVVDHASDTS